MSDDEYDIFSSLRTINRVKVPPKEAYSPSNESFSKELEAELLDEHSTTKKTSKAKVNDTTTAPTKKKDRKGKKNVQQDEKPPIGEEATGGQAKEPSRSLSPVSKMLFELEQEKAKAEEETSGPVARRTRSSLGKVANQPEVKQPSPPKRKKLTKKNDSKSKSDQRQTTILQSFSGTTSIPMPTSWRQRMAELAARSHVVDNIDLVSAVLPRVEGFVNLDSDDEAEGSKPVEEAPVESENPPMDIALSWLGEIQHYKLRQHRKFLHMFKEVAERNGVDVDDIVIDKYDTLVEPTDTPHSIGLMKFHTLTGRAMKSNNSHKNGAAASSVVLKKAHKFQLKVQGDVFKRPILIGMKKKDVFKELYLKCADELNCDVHLVKLFFDGELLDPEDTPKAQGMEGNEIIDLHLKT
ncbi:uncharacterized protein CG4449 [Drosophila guanche]|nr:uncharacterized protein CG4449 [Drosophila guanche]SPP80131.1 blast:TAF5-like RNA polymerase II p300/CBP-associated factor-associated factor 65 kDa subunit 5L [Drosophila guanche]